MKALLITATACAVLVDLAALAFMVAAIWTSGTLSDRLLITGVLALIVGMFASAACAFIWVEES